MADKKIIAVVGATGTQGGGLARAILDDFSAYRSHFVKVMPHEYRRALAEHAAEEAAKAAPAVVTEVVAHG